MAIGYVILGCLFCITIIGIPFGKQYFKLAMITVYIEDVADALDGVIDSWNQYLNTETGEIISLPSYDNDYISLSEEDETLYEEIDSTNKYLRLPDQYDIHEKSIMENFAYSLENQKHQDKLLHSLHGRKPYRHFKDDIIYLGIDKDYYKFRDDALYRLAIQWCEVFKVPYTTKMSKMTDGQKN